MIDTKIYKEKLETKLEQIVTDLKEIAVQNEATGDWVAKPDVGVTGNADENINADSTEEWNERRATIAKLETMYRNHTRALEKIAAGTYGLCEITNNPIEVDRLDANPAARTCKAHLEEEEKLPL